jgi:hypothetical protein
MQHLHDDLIQQLARRRADNAEHSHALWQMTVEQRVGAMRRGELTPSQLWEWAKQRPDEVPLLNGEFEFVAIFTPEAADLDRQQRGR